MTVADLEEEPGGPAPPLFWVKKKKSEKEYKSAGQAKQPLTLLPPPLARGLDPPLGTT